jgi:hypothetical protein
MSKTPKMPKILKAAIKDKIVIKPQSPAVRNMLNDAVQEGSYGAAMFTPESPV